MDVLERIFIRFLKERGAYREFCCEALINKRTQKKGNKAHMRDLYNSYIQDYYHCYGGRMEFQDYMKHVIDRALIWSSTESGSQYWQNRHREWICLFEYFSRYECKRKKRVSTRK
jgi:hypothetical protein